MKDIKTIVILILLAAIGIMYWFSEDSASEHSKTIIKLKDLNRKYHERDSIRDIEIDRLSGTQDSIRTERDTIYIYISKTDAKTRKNIVRIDSTPVMQLVRELSDRY